MRKNLCLLVFIGILSSLNSYAQPLQTAQASVGVGDQLVWGSAGYALTWPVWKRRLALGFGLRGTVEKSGERIYGSGQWSRYSLQSNYDSFATKSG